MIAIGFTQIYRQGAGLLDRLGETSAMFGRKPLVVTDSFGRAAFGARVDAALTTAGLSPEFFEHSGEVSPQAIAAVVAAARDKACDFAMGLGGGKILDLSKAVKLLLGLPVVVVPTVASNDAPTSRVIVTYNPDGTFIGPRFLDRNPDAVFVDTEVIAKAPVRFLIAGMGDALATHFEARQCLASGAQNFFAGRPTQTALALAELCYNLVRRHGEAAVQAVRAQMVNDDLERIVEANVLLSGLGFEGCGVAGAHAVSQGFTLIPELHGRLHGEEVAVGLLAQLVLEGRDQAFMADMFGFYRRVGLPASLADLGLAKPTPAQLETIAAFACRPKSRMYNMAVPVSVERTQAALARVEELAAATL
jgi:glycerol dehydrogenase